MSQILGQAPDHIALCVYHVSLLSVPKLSKTGIIAPPTFLLNPRLERFKTIKLGFRTLLSGSKNIYRLDEEGGQCRSVETVLA